jgi:hypothetical protein
MPAPLEQKGKDVGVVIEIAIVEGQPGGVFRNRLFAPNGRHHLQHRDDGVAARCPAIHPVPFLAGPSCALRQRTWLDSEMNCPVFKHVGWFPG